MKEAVRMEILVFCHCAGYVSVRLGLCTALLGEWVASHKDKQKSVDCELQ